MKDPDFTPAAIVLVVVRGHLELHALRPAGAGHAVLHREPSGAVAPRVQRGIAAFGQGVASRFSIAFENRVSA